MCIGSRSRSASSSMLSQPSIYHPSRETMKQDFQVPKLNEAGVGGSNAQLIGRPLEVAYWIQILGGLDGQSRVLLFDSTTIKQSEILAWHIFVNERVEAAQERYWSNWNRMIFHTCMFQ